MEQRSGEGKKKYSLRNRNVVKSPSQTDILVTNSNYKRSQPETNISGQEEKVYLVRSEPK